MNRTITIILGVVVLLVGGFFAFNSYIYHEKQGEDLSDASKINSEDAVSSDEDLSPVSPSPVDLQYEPKRMTLSGTQVCLQHKDTSGPQTMECAIGMLADDGKYYALDFGLMSQTPPEISNGQRFTASGVFTPIERLSTDHLRKYNMVGIFSVTNSVEVVPKQ